MTCISHWIHTAPAQLHFLWSSDSWSSKSWQPSSHAVSRTAPRADLLPDFRTSWKLVESISREDGHEEAIHRGTDHRLPEVGSRRHPDQGAVPQARLQRCLVLPVATQVWRHGRSRRQAPEGVGDGECPAQEASGRGDARQRSVEDRRAGKILSPPVRRRAVADVRAKLGVSERRACRILGLSRSVLHYQPAKATAPLQARLVELAGERRRFGYRRLHILLEREGWTANAGASVNGWPSSGGRCRCPPDRTTPGRWTLCSTHWPMVVRSSA